VRLIMPVVFERSSMPGLVHPEQQEPQAQLLHFGGLAPLSLNIHTISSLAPQGAAQVGRWRNLLTKDDADGDVFSASQRPMEAIFFRRRAIKRTNTVDKRHRAIGSGLFVTPDDSASV
jgi:hypothetical protein